MYKRGCVIDKLDEHGLTSSGLGGKLGCLLHNVAKHGVSEHPAGLGILEPEATANVSVSDRERQRVAISRWIVLVGELLSGVQRVGGGNRATKSQCCMKGNTILGAVWQVQAEHITSVDKPSSQSQWCCWMSAALLRTA